MAKTSKFTKVSVITSLSLEEAGALLHCLNYTIAKLTIQEDEDVLSHLMEVRASLLNAGVKIDGKSS